MQPTNMLSGTYQDSGKLITHPDYNIKGKNNQFGLLVELGCGELTHSNVRMETLTLLTMSVHNSATTFVPSCTFLLSSIPSRSYVNLVSIIHFI